MTRLYRAEFAKLLVRRLGWKGGGEKDGMRGVRKTGEDWVVMMGKKTGWGEAGLWGERG